ncbi:2-succinyl-5-enolpyruvyl-6-hydroxy-3-cyclohexene-1-carboxylic-acid synthase [Aureibaculum sp. 2210JD6-5]|uniref:2-succinyl-5-enolpyruvyl-6-hydroxy-3- cyclohexene-1-carboxylic-acid synthase n=1 Tax=Aureibaculum sp. 2210JD6-5 TaxID=3103957 RepID=UPI002AAC503A|nr:2-succinyl-5-enolpyruvyl-6-hydroxy-3-cyclohexene-1-carboxylic-acid synthase [Aureibaculum sp. 2210JD6-5]MDY7394363.1 2-succinyl-5-enolpyruvyl-6-hydroxy-3-cyclohexene-1-carboxylic-acid synthase [Aureibaculum sp. 2210JD6-5]
MTYSKKQLSQLIVESCVAYKIEHVIISPGSRNAPLTIGFTNHSKIKTYSIVDERCAAFFALGIAQQTQKPVALVCTSGSALLNYYPAFAEAFYSNILLIVISADRPKQLIDVGDGQTIRQENVFANHSLFNANLVEGEVFENENATLISKAIQLAIIKGGPTHINVPFDEPLYETTNSLSVNGIDKKLISTEKEIDYDFDYFAKLWNTSTKKMVLIGNHYPDVLLQQQLEELIKDKSVLIFTETTSNVHHPKFINSVDKLIFPLNDVDFDQLKPEILLTLGGMIVSKRIKQFLRKFKPEHHWHVNGESAPDTFHCLTQHFKLPTTVYFQYFLKEIKPVKSAYQKNWLSIKESRNKKQNQFIKNVEFSDFKVFDVILSELPDNVQLQLGNSSVVRYAQLFDNNPTIKVFCNRGTSGIDGSTSTAIGAASVNLEQTIFITGDISFFYDSNALWNSYIPNNFRIIVINNGGGGIFKILPGPQKTNALNYFETPHNLTAEHLCKMYKLDYFKAKNERELSNQLKPFFNSVERPKLLEIFTPNNLNDKVLKEYFKHIQ